MSEDYSTGATLHWEGETGRATHGCECSVCKASYSETHICVVPRDHPSRGRNHIAFTVPRDVDFEVLYSAVPFTVERE